MKKSILAFFSITVLTCLINAQPILNKPMVHSHNDYMQEIPFWHAYGNNAKSIEVDLVIQDGKLFISHGDDKIDPKRTIESLYLEPLKTAVELDIGNTDDLLFLVDMKSDAKASLDLLLPILKKYEDVIQKSGVKIVISGNRTPLSSYVNLPSYIEMDYQSLDPIQKKAELDKVAMISLAFSPYSSWKGVGKIPNEDQEKIKKVAETAHGMGKPLRFWGTPDSPEAWSQLWELGVDIINTDMPDETKKFFKN